MINLNTTTTKISEKRKSKMEKIDIVKNCHPEKEKNE